jgi:hypothetical protein
MVSELELEKRARRHALIFEVRCDLINWELDPTTRGWPATFSNPPKTFFPGFLRLTPHSKGGRKLCATLNAGDLVRYRLGWNIYSARIAFKDEATGHLWVHAFDLSNMLIRGAHLGSDETRYEFVKYTVVNATGGIDEEGLVAK